MPVHLDDRRGFLLGVLALLVSPLAVSASTKATLKGKLFATETDIGNAVFTLDPEGDSESIGITTTPQTYLVDYLAGCVGKSVTITIEPGA